jgi:5-methylcytosine-specific restriction enzyme A
MPARPTTFKPTRVHQSPLAQIAVRRGTTAERGYDADWKRLRSQFLLRNPVCVRCRRAGRVVPADTVNHRIDIALRPDLRLEWDNLEALCSRCHNRHTRTMQNARRPA